jgi:deoxyribodipyrimidine photolyase-like uncharacterized protein
VNLHRLLPSQVVADVLAMNAPLQSKEGFVRQVLGWREFVHHVHVATADRKTERGAVRRPRRQYTLR